MEYGFGFINNADNRDAKTALGSTVSGIAAVQFTLPASAFDTDGAGNPQARTIIYTNAAPTTTTMPNAKPGDIAIDYVNGVLHIAVGATFTGAVTSWANQA